MLQSKAAPVAEKIQDLIRTLAAKEAACPGLLSAEIASTSQAIGKAYRDFGQLDKALTYYYKALEAREIVLGEAHSSTLNTLDNIAAVFVDQTRYEEALDCYKQCLEKREATTSIGSNHPSALANKLMVGKMLSKLGQCDGALERLSQVHERYQSTIGATHLSALAALTEVATVQQKMGHRTSALINFRKVLEGRESVLGADHALTRETTQVISTLENQSNGEARGKHFRLLILNIPRTSGECSQRLIMSRKSQACTDAGPVRIKTRSKAERIGEATSRNARTYVRDGLRI